MPGWSGSERREGLPPDWARIRRRILKRDEGRCTHTEYGDRCPLPATDVDHIKPGNDHRDANLRSLCDGHHKTKSGREGAKAANAARRRNRQKFRRTERHPGLI